MADKEAAEIVLIESYLPKAAGEDEVVAENESRDRRDGLSHAERYGRGDEESAWRASPARHARRWENGQRDCEAGVGGEVDNAPRPTSLRRVLSSYRAENSGLSDLIESAKLCFISSRVASGQRLRSAMASSY